MNNSDFKKLRLLNYISMGLSISVLIYELFRVLILLSVL